MPWTLPAPVGAFLSTGGDYRAVILQMVNLAVGLIIYWPFVRRYDRFLQKQNPGSEQAQGGQGLVSELATPGSAGTLPRPDQTP
jgi:cellobiose-specific phosphotransferase system component IIC